MHGQKTDECSFYRPIPVLEKLIREERVPPEPKQCVSDLEALDEVHFQPPFPFAPLPTILNRVFKKLSAKRDIHKQEKDIFGMKGNHCRSVLRNS